jgi:hypothetical protein
MQVDPIGYPDGANRYLWERGAPASRLDSQGLTSTGDDQARNTVVGIASKESRSSAGYIDENGQVSTQTAVTRQPVAVFADGHQEPISTQEAEEYSDALLQLAMGPQLLAFPPKQQGVPRHGTTQPATTQPTGRPTKTPQQELDDIYGKAAMWKVGAQGWWFDHQCAQQAKELRDYLRAQQFDHWDFYLVGGESWAGFHHHVVLLVPMGHCSPEYTLDAYQGWAWPWDSPTLQKYADFKKEFPYPGDSPHPGIRGQ